ncbi:DnaD domain protein [bacterium]|nr:DnaD domain protein [bacterium]
MEKKKEIELKRDNNFILDSADYQILELLYKPMIGVGSLNIYKTLYSISYSLNSSTFKYLTIFDMSGEDALSFEKISKHLETLSYVGLLVISDKITLYPPYDKDSFIKTDLIKYLRNYVSSSQFSLLSKSFNFNELEIDSSSSLELKNLKNTITKNTRKYDATPFDFYEFSEIVSKSVKINNNDSFTFTSIANLFNLSLNEMVRIMYDIQDEDSYDIKKFINKAYEKYSKNQLKKEREEKEDLSDQKYINYFLNTKPESLIMNGSKYQSNADLNTLSRMRNELNLDDPIISLLIAYSLSTNGKKMHSFKFYDTIKKDWDNNNIVTVRDAFLYINSLYSKQFKNTKIKSDEEPFDDWYKSFIKNS